MRLIDTHAHLFADEFAADYSDAIARAQSAGVEHIFLQNIDASTIDALHRLERQCPPVCHAFMGIHPTSVTENYKKEIARFDAAIAARNYIGIGEIGLDLYWSSEFFKEQKKVFEYQIAISIEKELPVAIHCRDAFAEIVESLRQFDASKLNGIFHSFTGAPDEAETIFSLGNFVLGINGIVTYKSATFANTLNQIPLSKIVLETDCPYLSPVPHRGKRNESSYLPYIVNRLSEVYQILPTEIAETTTQNVKKMFPSLIDRK